VQFIYGVNPVLEALKLGHGVIEKVVISRSGKDQLTKNILDLADKKGVIVEYKDKSALERLAGNNSHQGIVGVCRRYKYSDIEDIINNRHSTFKYSLILIADGINDPQNLGSLIRTAHCLGANGIVIPANRSAQVTAAAVKASAGAAHYTPVAMVVNIASTIDYLKDRGFWIYGTEADSGKPLNSLEYATDIAVVVGSEGGGMRPLVKKKCDFLLSVPMQGKIDSMNVSVAAGIIVYEISRKFTIVSG
jgi:23S rRNA (guanosine2251-2'-O)-methyltransferase